VAGDAPLAPVGGIAAFLFPIADLSDFQSEIEQIGNRQSTKVYFPLCIVKFRRLP
jgi:hypothetical protein